MAKLTNAQLAAENASLRDQLNTRDLIHARDLAVIKASIANAQPSPNRIIAGAAQPAQGDLPAWRMQANAKLARMHQAWDEAIQSGRMTRVAA